MARNYRSGAIEVGTAPSLICVVGQGITECHVQNVSTKNVFIGGPDVEAKGAALGFRLKPGEDRVLATYEHDSCEVYGIASEGSATVVFLVEN